MITTFKEFVDHISSQTANLGDDCVVVVGEVMDMLRCSDGGDTSDFVLFTDPSLPVLFRFRTAETISELCQVVDDSGGRVWAYRRNGITVILGIPMRAEHGLSWMPTAAPTEDEDEE